MKSSTPSAKAPSGQLTDTGTICSVTEDEYELLTAVWEESVRATHHFLSEEDISSLRPRVLNDYLASVVLRAYRDADGHILGFVGVSGNRIEMLFISPESRGKGIGRRLLQHAISEMGATILDVNEQNPQALEFYLKMGFRIIGRSPLDMMGNPFPLLHLELSAPGIQKCSARINERDMEYFIQGDGAPVLLVHGALADHRIWEKHSAFLADGYKAISFTQRYFGKRAAVVNDDYPFGITTHMQDLRSLIETADQGPVHLVAWSYGADVALALAIQAPHLVRSLFLYEPGCPAYLNEDQMQCFMSDAEEMFGPIFPIVAQNHLEKAARLMMDASGGREGYFEEQDESLRVHQLENAHSLALQMTQTEPPAITTEQLNQLRIPVALLRGEKTRPLFRAVFDAASDAIHGVHARVIPDVGHMLPLEDPAAFVQLVRTFIDELDQVA
ncbi:alpha/beta fold hydrolase [Nitrincola alkalilacustris]|uniref:alpha/beta fold hydrolase n=1 Tax=Nitrincola alkalilacustris TaxID=1571224 RepID=UPI00124E0543|nr:alpha/beta fold hydrolase [Nitrincola alkalilacustris]